MKKLIALIAFGGTMTMLSVEDPAAQAPAADSGTEPCPLCCPPEICGYNGPSFDGKAEPVSSIDTVARSGR